MTKTKAKNAALILLAFALMVSGSFLGTKLANTGNSIETVLETAETEQTGNIAIPGFEEIRFKAQQTAQNVYFYNPSENSCYFTISLFLDDMELFTSDMIAPSEEITEIELFQPLSAGVYYEGVIRYSCYDLETMDKLNGADVVTRLEVDP